MIIDFFQPPPAQRVGGLDLATKSLKSFLQNSGITVRQDPTMEAFGESKAPELVHFHGLWQRKFPRISAECRRRNIPYIVSPHGMLEPWAWRHKRWKKWPYFHLIERRHLAQADRLLSTSSAESRNLEEFFPRSSRVVLPLGLTEQRQANYERARDSVGWKDSEIVLLFLSRIHPKKGLPMLLQALASLGPNAWPRPARLVIVGGGAESYVRGLKAIVGEEQTRLPQVDWIGEVWDESKWTYLEGADLVCVPSYSENFGFVVLESLQVGTRVLTTSGTPWELLTSWGAGWIVPPTVPALTEALCQYLADPEWTIDQRRRLATETRARFSWDTIGPSYLRFYEDVLADGGRQSVR